ncbi:M16 family metallopeptidase [Sphingomonas colocasiae]|uniref:Peptidase M16 C-terminal domain-containing protein n=1 Tax=Sphingomonas colocasiae TaxID=1848973 RepID=A0ABS7PID8_9SPHN|nr:insulinase family protein [Sphingomonas colocasiae]MBY8821065.1 hypothetical protein [Sphingomonas colocasiae]
MALIRSGLFLISLAIVPIPHLQAQPVSNSAMVEGSEFRFGTLPNGMRYIIERTANPETVVMLAVNAGDLDQEADQGAAAHVIEHIGLQFGAAHDASLLNLLVAKGQIKIRNGSTGMRGTDYWLQLPREAAATPEDVIRVVSDWLTGAPIDEASVQRERVNVGSEHSRVDSALTGQNEVIRQAFGSRIAEARLMELRGVQQMSAASVRRFYEKWYRPDLATIIVSGEIDISEWIPAVESLGSLPNPSGPSPRGREGRRSERSPGLAMGMAPRYLAVERDDESPAVRVAILPRSLQGSLVDEPRLNIRKALLHRLALQAAGSMGFALEEPHLPDIYQKSISMSFELNGDTERGNGFAGARTAMGNAIRNLRTVQKFGVSEVILAQARRSVLKQVNEEFKNPVARVREYKDMAQIGAISRLPSGKEAKSVIDTISLSEVNNYLRKAIRFDRDFDIAVTGPRGALTPELKSALMSARSSGMKADIRRPEAQPRLDSIAEPAGSEDQARVGPATVDQQGIGVLDLPSGQRVILKHVDSGALVASAGSITSNEDLLSTANPPLYSISDAFIARPERLDEMQYREFLNREGLASEISLSADRTILTISGRSDSADSLFQAVRVVLKSAQSGTGVNFLQSYGGTPAGARFDYRSGFREAIALSADSSEMLGKGFKRFSPQTILITGDFEIVDAIALTTKYLSDIAPAMPKTSPTSLPKLSYDDGLSAKKWVDGRKITRLFTIATEDKQDIYANSRLVAQILNDRLFDLLRNNGVYTGASVNWRVWPAAAGRGEALVDVRISYLVGDASPPGLSDLVDQEIDSLQKGNFSLGDFDGARRKVAEVIATSAKIPSQANELAMPILLNGGEPRAAFTLEHSLLEKANFERVKKMAESLFNRD